MKDVLSKIIPVFTSLKGKKPIVIIVAALAIAAGFFAVHKGYITEDNLNIDAIIKEVSNAFESAPSVDSVTHAVDSVAH